MLKRHFDEEGVTIHAFAQETGISERGFYRKVCSFQKMV
jgi:hypothetical protein